MPELPRHSVGKKMGASQFFSHCLPPLCHLLSHLLYVSLPVQGGIKMFYVTVPSECHMSKYRLFVSLGFCG